MLLQTNSYIVPKERRAEHARLIRRFRQALARIGCDQFEVYEQVGANWSSGGANGRYVQIMRFRDRQHQQAVQAAERDDHGAQHIIAEFCELINFPYQQQHGYFATGFYTSVLPVGPKQAIGYETPEVSQHYTGDSSHAADTDETAYADEPLDPEDTPESLAAEPAAQVAAEAATADSFLDTLAGDEPSADEPDGPVPTSHEPAHDEGSFAEAPIAIGALAPAAEDELVTAEAFVPNPAHPHDDSLTPVELGELDLTETEEDQIEHMTDEIAPELLQNLSPDGGPEFTHPDAGNEPGVDLTPVETDELIETFDHTELGELPMIETLSDTEVHELGLGFEPTPTKILAGDPLIPLEIPDLESVDLPFVEEPAANHENRHSTSHQPPATDAHGQEFELDEGLIFDEDENPSADPLLESIEPLPLPTSTLEITEAPHGQSPFASDVDRGPIKFGAKSHDAAFDEMLENANLLSHAPSPDNGRAPAANHPGHEPNNPDAQKDADLLEFDAFLRQLDEEHGRAK